MGLYIYKPNKNEHISTKPDGYYFQDGVTFILDAKAQGKKFIGQLEDYMKLEKNENFIGFKYNADEFLCYVKGELKKEEVSPQSAQYYLDKFLPLKQTNSSIVENSAKKLANMFRNSNINKQMNVPVIGAIMLCLKFKKNIIANTTEGILRLIKEGIEEIISDNPLNRKEKKEFLKTALGDSTLRKSKFTDLLDIIGEVSTIFNFINVSDKKGHDTMNNFLKVFRKWNSADAQEKGQVFTPDHIAQLMYNIINCNKNDKILDPTCGSGTFLTNALANMLSETKNLEEQKDIKENRIFGIELDDFSATLAGINMMLHGDGASNIFCMDCFVKLPKLKNCYNKILMNPPFSVMVPELKFVLKSLDNCEKDGLCAAILPISCAIGSKFKEERKEILKFHTLLKIVTLPKDLFQPNAGIATCIMVFKAHNKHSKKIEQYDFSDDGFIVAKHIGRIDKNNREKTKVFLAQKPIFKQVTYKDNWLLEKEVDYSQLTKLDFIKTKLDFIKTKLDFMLINKDLKEEVLKGNGKFKLTDEE